jgi:hypothetical protein
MKKIIIPVSFLLLAVGCTKDLTNTLNTDPKQPLSVPSYSLFTNAERFFTNNVTSSNVNLNIFRLVDQYWQETTYTDESNYDLVTRQIPDRLWAAMYRDVLQDLQAAKNLIPADVIDPVTQGPDVTRQKNEIAIADVLQVYTWYYLVTTWGNIPYSQALNIDNKFPKFDDQQAIYNDLLTRLDADITNMNVADQSFGEADIIYGGDVSKWKKFANTLKVKMAMTIADVDNAKAKTLVEAAVASGIFTSNADNAVFQYLDNPPNTNPIWVDLIQSGRKDFVAASTIVNAMKPLNDPRLPLYFTTDNAGGYSGGAPGASSNFATFSKPAATITEPDFPATILSYSELEFFLAEAVERGYNVGGTATTHYNNAITASILEWGGTTTQAAAYLLQPTVNYATAGTTYKQKIGMQKWIALYNRGWDAWNEIRRLDYPLLVAPSTAKSAFPVRFTYPVNEQNVNTTNYNSASAAIGSDKVSSKLFWDKF